jgi:iron complex transport system substrate-binding protein
MLRFRSLGGLAVLALALVASACSSSSSPSPVNDTPAAQTFPMTINAANGKVTLDAQPQRIVSLSPTATEMLFAIGAGNQVVAVDSYSNYPPEAPTTDLAAINPNIEAIAKYQPDLVVYSYDPGDLQDSLDKLKIPALLQPAAVTLDDVGAQMVELGTATGHTDQANAEAQQVQTSIDDIVAQVGDAGQGKTYYYELDDTYYSLTSDTFVGTLLAKLGLTNIADKAKGASSGYPQLSAEYIIDQNPDLILLADTKCCNQSAATVAKRPGWADLTAVQNGGVVPLDDDVASRWGPRVVDLLQQVADSLTGQTSSASASAAA